VDDAVVRETVEDLKRLEARSPQAQIRAIHLLGLEREQIVAVAYREDAIRARLETIEVDEASRDAIRHAMRWVWKEEQMHATFVRGVLLRAGGPILRARAFMQQLAGAIAGWSSATLHHVRFRDAPLSRFWAHVFTFFGWLAGKVPRAVTRSLRHLSFRDYCRFSRSAEATAALCWHRVAELMNETDRPDAARFYAQMGGDEDHHGQIFELLLESLDDEARLRDGWDAEALRERLAAIGPFYVAREHRADAETNPLGAGGAVHVVCDRPGCDHAPDGGDPESALDALLARVDLEGLVRERAEATGRPVEALRVAIKPTFMRAYHRDDPTPTTSPALVNALARRLRALGCADVAVLESAHIYDWFHEGRDVASVAEYVGLDEDALRVVDVEDDLVAHRFARGMSDELVCATWRDADVRISFGKLTTHPVDRVYLGISQLESLVPRSDENVFVERRIHRGPATMALLGEHPPHLALLDAYEACADGIGGILASERPRHPRRLYGGRDALAVDLTAARHAGEDDPRESHHLDTAMHWFDDPRGRTDVCGCDAPLDEWRPAVDDERTAMLAFVAHPMYVLASGRGALFVPEMDEDAFPPKAKPGPALLALRALIRRLLRIRRPSWSKTRPLDQPS